MRLVLILLPVVMLAQTWSSPSALTTEPSDSIRHADPSLTSTGTLFVVCWTRLARSGGSFSQSTVLYSVNSGGEWTPGRPVSEDTTHFDHSPSVACAWEGTPFVVWSRADGPPALSTSLYWSEYSHGWSDPRQVPAGTGEPWDETASALADRGGRLWVVWAQYDTAPEWLRACAVCRQNGEWSPVRVISRAPGFQGNFYGGFGLAQDPLGRVWAAWRASYQGESYTTYTSYYDGENWVEPMPCHQPGLSGDLSSALVTDGSGRLTVFWGSYDGVWWARYDSTGWNSQGRVEPRPAVDCVAATGPRGGLWLAWDEEHAGQPDIYAKLRDSTGWLPKVPVDTHPARDVDPVIAAGSSSVWVVWTRVDTGQTQTVNLYASHSRVTGVAERPPTQSKPTPFPTHIRAGPFRIPGQDVEVFNPTGRRVANDRFLKPGVYIVRATRNPGDSPPSGTVPGFAGPLRTKVVVTH